MPGKGMSVLLVFLLSACTGLSQQRVGLARRPGSQRTGSRLCPGPDFEGTVIAGKSFHKSIGGGLDFVLEAAPNGWIVRVLPSSGVRSEPDFAEVATPPFRSMNPLLLTTDFGLRAQDVIGWNPRTFRYLRDGAEFAEAQRVYRATTATARPTREQEAAVTRIAVKAMEGRLDVLDAVLTPGTADQTVSAGLVAGHFASTAHTFRPPESRSIGPAGKVLSLRFRVRLSDPGRTSCKESTNLKGKP